MYTQCPDCKVAFRITAQVLQQARGRVRCGNCGEPFNALDHLSENPPVTTDASTEGVRPLTREQGRELMNTLDQFAETDDVRIEDTGAEWRVLGDEVGDPGDSAKARIPDVQPGDSSANGEPAGSDEQQRLAFTDEPRYDDNTPLPDDFDADHGDTVAWEAPRRRATDFEFSVSEVDESQAELELSEPDDWADLLDEMDKRGEAAGEGETDDGVARGDAASAQATDEASHEEFGAEIGADASRSGSFTIIEDAATDRPRQGGDTADDEDADRALAITDDTGLADLSADAGGTDEEPDEEGPEVDARSSSEEWHLASEDADGSDDQAEADSDADSAAAGDDEADEEDSSGRFERAIASAEGDGYELPPGDVADEDAADADSDDGAQEAQPGIGAMTGNISIDPETLRAFEDKSMVETIVMEGDRVRGELEDENLHQEAQAAASGDPDSLLDTYITSRTAEHGDASGRTLMLGGIVVLVLGLAAQYLHNERAWLATFDLFDRTVAPIYRSLGMPIRPHWDISAWQFEATSGSTGADGTLLTITSRISNRSSAALPYPLVHVSLTDRYEEVIGSRMLEPADYLGDGPDPGLAVSPGGNFTATITIASTSPEATGFKLNVCYPEDGDRLRCAIEDFKEP